MLQKQGRDALTLLLEAWQRSADSQIASDDGRRSNPIPYTPEGPKQQLYWPYPGTGNNM